MNFVYSYIKSLHYAFTTSVKNFMSVKIIINYHPTMFTYRIEQFTSVFLSQYAALYEILFCFIAVPVPEYSITFLGIGKLSERVNKSKSFW